MILDLQKYEIRDGTGIKGRQDVYKITKLESEIINVLKDYRVHKVEEITYRSSAKTRTSTRVAIMRLKRKIPALEIEARNRIGYLLRTHLREIR